MMCRATIGGLATPQCLFVVSDSALGLIDVRVVSVDAFLRALNDALIAFRVGAATDPNASHARAQNENVIHYATAGRAGACSDDGFCGRLLSTIWANKAGNGLPATMTAVRDGDGRIVPVMTTMAQIVGLNHLATGRVNDRPSNLRGRVRSWPRSGGQEIDRCIVHHGLDRVFSSGILPMDATLAGHGVRVDPHSGRRS